MLPLLSLLLFLPALDEATVRPSVAWSPLSAPPASAAWLAVIAAIQHRRRTLQGTALWRSQFHGLFTKRALCARRDRIAALVQASSLLRCAALR